MKKLLIKIADNILIACAVQWQSDFIQYMRGLWLKLRMRYLLLVQLCDKIIGKWKHRWLSLKIRHHMPQIIWEIVILKITLEQMPS